MPAQGSSSTSAPASGSSDQPETLTPAQLRDGVKLTAGPEKVVINVIGISGKPATSDK